MNKEIERKFSIKYLPDDIKISRVYKTTQGFLYHDGITIVRIRKIEENQNKKYIYTVKTNGEAKINKKSKIANKYEIENEISKEEYERLSEKIITNIIEKTRVVIPIENNLKSELDIYYNYLEGFISIEVEFPDEKSAEEFEKPKWFGEEIGYKEFSNRKLSLMTKEEFLNIVSKEKLENNRKILNDNKKIKTII